MLTHNIDTWGLADVEAAVAAIPEYIISTDWIGPRALVRSLYITGHSNGGQGAWHLLTHIPDRIRAAAPVSGYVSIQKYVPYEFSREIDPKISSIIQGSLSSCRHELLVENAKGIPIQQQHGNADDNVPVFHSRRMLQLLKESGSDPKYHEIPGKGHWYPGIMGTTPLLDFYQQISQDKNGNTKGLPTQFSFIIPNTGEVIGPRGGIVVEQLYSLGQLGRLDVDRISESLWSIKTSNVRRLRIGFYLDIDMYPEFINIDGTLLEIGVDPLHTTVWLYLDQESQWKVCVLSIMPVRS